MEVPYLEKTHMMCLRFRVKCIPARAGDYPTLPSRLTPRSFCASTANSMGSSLKTSLQKPLTIMLTASSAEKSALFAVKDLVLALIFTLTFVLDPRRRVLHLDVGKRVRTAPVPQEKRIALGKVPRVGSDSASRRRAPVGVLPVPRRRSPWRQSCSWRSAPMWTIFVPASACWRLLLWRQSRTRRQNCRRWRKHARIFPRDRGPGFHLRPGNPRIPSRAFPPLGHEVEISPSPLRPPVPVLHRRILHLGVLQRDELDDGGMESRCTEAKADDTT